MWDAPSSSGGHGAELRRASTNPPNEYTITKKLVIVSTLHVLLNLPRYCNIVYNEAVYNEAVGGAAATIEVDSNNFLTRNAAAVTR